MTKFHVLTDWGGNEWLFTGRPFSSRAAAQSQIAESRRKEGNTNSILDEMGISAGRESRYIVVTDEELMAMWEDGRLNYDPTREIQLRPRD